MNRYLVFAKNDLLILLSGMLGCGLVALVLGKDLSWDVANYHYYIPYAFLHQRWLQDFWPASYPHMNFSPGADLLSYYLITYFSVNKAVFTSGAIQGINFWLLYKIADLFWRVEHAGVANHQSALAFALLGLCQPLVILSMGAFENDLIVSIFVLGAFYVTCLWLQNYSIRQTLSYRWIAVTGVLLGVATGLKLTVAGFGVGSALALLCLPMPLREKCKITAVLGMTAITGLLLSNGYWMLNLWQRFHNPFYPFLGLQGAAVQDQVMAGWKANDWKEMLLFPFGLARDGSLQFLEFQFGIVCLLFIFTAVMRIYPHKIRQLGSQKNLLITWLYAFFIFSYIVWEKYFGVARYIRSLAMLSPLLIYVLLNRLTPAPFWKYFSLTLVMVAATFYISLSLSLGGVRWMNFQNSYFNVALPAAVQESQSALVLMSYPDYALYWNPRPQTYLIPFFPPAWHFAGIPFNNRQQTWLAPTELLKIKAMIASESRRIYLLTSNETLPQFYRVATALGLHADGVCGFIFSDRQLVSHTRTLLCPLARLS